MVAPQVALKQVVIQLTIIIATAVLQVVHRPLAIPHTITIVMAVQQAALKQEVTQLTIIIVMAVPLVVLLGNHKLVAILNPNI